MPRNADGGEEDEEEAKHIPDDIYAMLSQEPAHISRDREWFQDEFPLQNIFYPANMCREQPYRFRTISIPEPV